MLSKEIKKVFFLLYLKKKWQSSEAGYAQMCPRTWHSFQFLNSERGRGGGKPYRKDCGTLDYIFLIERPHLSLE